MSYVLNVAEILLARCSNITILSPTDFAIIAEWEKQEIPLDVALKSIHELCDEATGVRSVSDFQTIVRKNFVQWLQEKDQSTI